MPAVSDGDSGPLWWSGLPAGPTRDPLTQEESVDVAIVGGGFTGLWAAYYLLEADPSLKVLVLEAEHVGFGASGRNGGWVSALYPVGAHVLAREHGEAATRDQYAALRDSVDEVGRVAGVEDIECGFHKGGTLVVATNRAQATRSRAEVQDSEYWGTGMTWLEAPAAADRLAVKGLHGATFNPNCARSRRRSPADRSWPRRPCSPHAQGDRGVDRTPARPSSNGGPHLLPGGGHRAPAAVDLGPDRPGRRRDVQRESPRHRVRPAVHGRPDRLRRSRCPVSLRLGYPARVRCRRERLQDATPQPDRAHPGG